MNAVALLWVALVYVVFGVATALIARSKGQTMAWALLALVVPLIALIVVLFLPRKTPPTYATMQPLNPPPPPPPPPLGPDGAAT